MRGITQFTKVSKFEERARMEKYERLTLPRPTVYSCLERSDGAVGGFQEGPDGGHV